MMYKVHFTEKNYGSVTVEADSAEAAQEAAEEAYVNGEAVWGKTDFQIGGYEEA